MLGGLSPKIAGLALVGLFASPGGGKAPQVMQGWGAVLGGGFVQPIPCGGLVPGRAYPGQMRQRKVHLRDDVAGVGGAAEMFHGFVCVRLKAGFAEPVQHPEIAVGQGIAAVARFLKEPPG